MDMLLPEGKMYRQGRGRRLAAWLLVLLLASPAAFAAQHTADRITTPIIAQIDGGHFKAADAAITTALAQPGLPADTQRALAFQRERMRRILLDFTLSADDVEARVRKQIPDLTAAEFANGRQPACSSIN
jgi:hypothetical protein